MLTDMETFSPAKTLAMDAPLILWTLGFGCLFKNASSTQDIAA